MEPPKKDTKTDTAVKVSGYAECLSLALVAEDSVSGICVRCEQVNDLLCLVAELKEEVERLRNIREREIDWWSPTLSPPKEVQQETVKPCPSCHQANQVDGNRSLIGEIPLQGILSFKRHNSTSQLNILGKLAGAFMSCIQINELKWVFWFSS
ncbi:hypothetical protein BTVI_07039 [Pitangus sulphuratus]|nr:hypothetical protein BTVI_07039 [Pitangus sulphuratus]